MSKETLQRQADRADRIADQTVDEGMRRILRDAAKEYREKAQQEPAG